MRARICSRSASCSTKWRQARGHFEEKARGRFSMRFSTALLSPPVRLNPDVPAELERVIDKCLEKDRNLRYQHASEIRTDLQRLKRDTDSGRVTSRAEPAVTTVTRWKMIVPAARRCWRSPSPGTSMFIARQHSPTRTRLSSRISRTRPATRCLTTRCARDCPWSFNNLRSSVCFRTGRSSRRWL